MNLKILKKVYVKSCFAVFVLFVFINVFFKVIHVTCRSCEETRNKKSVSREISDRNDTVTNPSVKGNVNSVNISTEGKVKIVDIIKYRRSDMFTFLSQLARKRLHEDFTESETINLDQKLDSKLKDFALEICPFCQPPTLSSDNKTQKILDGSLIPDFQANLTTAKLVVLKDKMTDSYFKPREEVMNTLPFTFRLLNKQLCVMPDGKRPFLLTFVCSVADHFEERQGIRDTWGSLAYTNGLWGNIAVRESMRLMFFIGNVSVTNGSDGVWKLLSEESRNYGDIVVADFVDNYRNLSLKVIMALHWVNQYCDGVSHVLKVDEDTFIHVPKLMSLLKQVETQYKTFVMGRGHAMKKPGVLRTGKWAVGNEYPKTYFPWYLYGHSYVISGPTVKVILNTFEHMPLVPNEDAYITGILSKSGNVTRLSCPLFAFPYRQTSICRLARGHFISETNTDTKHHRAIHDDLKAGFCDWRLGMSV